MTLNRFDSKRSYREIILQSTLTLDYIKTIPDTNSIIWLALEIKSGKKKLRYNSVDYIIGKFLSKNQDLLSFKKGFVDIYVIGTFKTKFVPTEKVAEALSYYYLETNILPNIIPLSKREFLENLKFSIKKIKNGILIYDRERDLH